MFCRDFNENTPKTQPFDNQPTAVYDVFLGEFSDAPHSVHADTRTIVRTKRFFMRMTQPKGILWMI